MASKPMKRWYSTNEVSTSVDAPRHKSAMQQRAVFCERRSPRKSEMDESTGLHSERRGAPAGGTRSFCGDFGVLTGGGIAGDSRMRRRQEYWAREAVANCCRAGGIAAIAQHLPCRRAPHISISDYLRTRSYCKNIFCFTYSTELTFLHYLLKPRSENALFSARSRSRW